MRTRDVPGGWREREGGEGGALSDARPREGGGTVLVAYAGSVGPSGSARRQPVALAYIRFTM